MATTASNCKEFIEVVNEYLYEDLDAKEYRASQIMHSDLFYFTDNHFRIDDKCFTIFMYELK